MLEPVVRWVHARAARAGAATFLLCFWILGAATAADRPAFGLGGVGLEIGVASPEYADLAPQFGGVVHLGSFFKPWLHLTAGVSYWSTDIDRSELGSDVRGSIADLAIRSDLRWEAGRLFGLYPYLATGLAAHNVSADIPDDRSVERALAGLNWGFDAGIGVMSAAQGFRYGVEFRRRFVSDVDGWTAVAAAGWFFPRASRSRAYSVEALRSAQAPPGYVVVSDAQRAAPSGVSAAELTKLTGLLSELIQLTRAQRAELDDLRQRLQAAAPAEQQAADSAQKTSPPVTTVPATLAPVPSAPAATAAVSRLDSLRQALGRAAELAGSSDALRATPDGLLLVLPGTLLFGTASSDLQVESREAMRRIALVLMRFPDVLVSIEGHADSRGDPAFNLNLSRERAAAVSRELMEQGIGSQRLTIIGVGVTAPIADNDTAAGRALNRRVELRFRFESPVRRDAGSVR